MLPVNLPDTEDLRASPSPSFLSEEENDNPVISNYLLRFTTHVSKASVGHLPSAWFCFMLWGIKRGA